MEIKKHLDLLGLKAIDKITGFSGVIESVSFDLYGCIQAVIRPSTLDKEGDTRKGEWMDVGRLKITGKKPVMKIPDFDYSVIGPANKSTVSRQNKPI